jgi:hypothetical protein
MLSHRDAGHAAPEGCPGERLIEPALLASPPRSTVVIHLGRRALAARGSYRQSRRPPV